MENIRNGFRSRIWDAIIFEKTAMVLGGRIRVMVTGAAPLPGPIMEFLKVGLTCQVAACTIPSTLLY